MNDDTVGSERARTDSPRAGYFMVAGEGGSDDGITLLAVWNIFWSQRWLIILICTLFALCSIGISLAMTEFYRADSVLAPVTSDDVPDVAGRLGGLASLAGIRMGGGSDGTNAVAILRSREFAAAFIEQRDLIPLFFEDMWDAQNGEWSVASPDEIPKMYDAVKYFRESIFSVKEDPVSGLVTIAIEWKDPEVAAEWVNSLVERINRETRERALDEAGTNLSYLQSQLETAAVMELRSAISRIIESEMKKIMIANAREQYAFRVIDTGMVPTRKVRPRRALIVITSTFLGGVFALVVALLRHTLRNQNARAKERLDVA